MALVVVPVDLVDLVLDLERLDHALGHQRHDPHVLAPVQDQQRRLDPLGTVDRGATPVRVASLRIIGHAHHLLEIEATGPVTVTEALGDLRIAVEIDTRRPQRGLLDERA
jgi:hypothetical protein